MSITDQQHYNRQPREGTQHQKCNDLAAHPSSNQQYSSNIMCLHLDLTVTRWNFCGPNCKLFALLVSFGHKIQLKLWNVIITHHCSKWVLSKLTFNVRIEQTTASKNHIIKIQ